MPIKIFAESEGLYRTVEAAEGGFVCCFDVVTIFLRSDNLLGCRK
jgi:hypothetical protein